MCKLTRRKIETVNYYIFDVFHIVITVYQRERLCQAWSDLAPTRA